MHQPIGAILKRLRERLGFRTLQSGFDDAIVRLSLIRNCLAHNGGKVDRKLAAMDATAALDTKIVVTSDDVRAAIGTFKRVVTAVDAAFR